MTGSSTVRVSVVVAVYNPGEHIMKLIASLRHQTLDDSEFEVIFVDDGSTDDTPPMLDQLTVNVPNFKVIHISNSGWPGKPRNVGLAAAQGEYVFICDHDDYFAEDALERLSSFAATHGSDVTVGKIKGVGRNAPKKIFTRSVVDAQANMSLLMTSLTPQKLYRRSFLLQEDIWFPEGERRLEDHLFVTKAYLRAKRISIYAETTIYYFVLREDGANASRRKVEWAGYFSNAAESVAVVDLHAPDEETRLIMRGRWLRTEALGRVRGRTFLTRPDRSVLLSAVAKFVSTHYGQADFDRLPPLLRLKANLLKQRRLEDVVALATLELDGLFRGRVLRVIREASPAHFLVDYRLLPSWRSPALRQGTRRRMSSSLLHDLEDMTAGTGLTARAQLKEVNKAGVLYLSTDQPLNGSNAHHRARIDASALEGCPWRFEVGLVEAGADQRIIPRMHVGAIIRGLPSRPFRSAMSMLGGAELHFTNAGWIAVASCVRERQLARRVARGAIRRLRRSH